MLILIGQFNKVSGPDAVRQYKVEFTIDESQRQYLKDLYDYEKGAAFVISLVEIDDAIIDSKHFILETEKETVIRFRKRMHALISEIAKDKNLSETAIKDSLRKYLKAKKYLENSTSELTAEGYAAAIHILQTEF